VLAYVRFDDSITADIRRTQIANRALATLRARRDNPMLAVDA